MRRLFRYLLLFRPFHSKIDYIKTILLNFSVLPFKQAIKLPIILYNNVKIITIGDIKIQGSIKTGMIKIGVNDTKAHGPSKILLSGELILKGKCDIFYGTVLEGKGKLTFGNNVRIAENCKIMCQHSINIGNNCYFGYDSIIMDTDFHYLVNINTGMIKKNFAPVSIGDGSWISSGCKIMKGTILPKGSIVVGNSLVNKNFKDVPANTIFIGTPAKAFKQGYQRLFNTKIENEITNFFIQNPQVDTYLINLETFNKKNYE